MSVGTSMLPSGRLARNEPHIQIIGHYAAPINGALSIGSSGRADLVLTEPDIDALHGWLIADGRGAWRYVHASPTMPASRDDGFTTERQRIRRGDRIVVQPAGDAPPVCSTGGLGTALSVGNATTVLVRSGEGESGVVSVPDGDFFPLANGGPPLYLASCDSRVGITLETRCSEAFRSVESVIGNVAATLGHPSPISADFASLLPRSDVRLATLRQLRVGVPLFARREGALVATTGRPFKPVQPAAPQLTPPDTLYSIVSAAASFPLSLAGRWFHHDGERTLLVRRGGDPSQSVWRCGGETKAELVGEVRELRNGSDIILGQTQYRIVQPEQQSIALYSMERSDRRHFFLSLSSGRLDAFGARQEVPACGVGRVRFIGQGERNVPAAAAGDDDLHTVIMSLRLPSGVAAAHPRIAQGHTSEIDMGSVCAAGDGLSILPPKASEPNVASAISQPVDADGNPLHHVAPGGRFLLAGHVFEFRDGSPRYEQLAMLIGFAIFLGLAGRAAVSAIDCGLHHGLDEQPGTIFGRGDFTRFVAVITAAMTSLMICGALLLMQMAVNDDLIGKPDYVHRHIFMCAVAAILFVAIFVAAVASGPADESSERADNDRAVERDDAPLADQILLGSRRAAGVLVVGGMLLVMWIIVDAVGWLIAARDWLRSADVPAGTIVADWLHSFSRAHFGLFGIAAAFVFLTSVIPARIRSLLVRAKLRKAWRLTATRPFIVASIAVAALICGAIYTIECRPPWFVLAAWVGVGVAVAPLIEAFSYGDGPLRRPRRARAAVMIALLLVAAGRIPRDSLDAVELSFFLLLTAVVVAGVALGALVAVRCLGRWPRFQSAVARRLGMDIDLVPAPPIDIEHHVQLLALGFVALAFGLVVGSGQWTFGMKPAEFAVWFLAVGLAMFLAKRWDLVQTGAEPRSISRLEFRLRIVPLVLVVVAAVILLFIPHWRLLSFSVVTVGLPVAIYMLPRSGWRRASVTDLLARARLPITTSFLMLSIEAVVLVLYAGQGDFGPLLVLVPAVLCTMIYWSLAPERKGTSGTLRRGAERLGIAAGLFAASLGLVAAGYVLVTSVSMQNLPFIGKSVHRAADRLQTYTDPWYTSSGSWSVTANWIAAGYTEERYLSNLHSDLATIAFRQGFGVVRTSLMAGAYLLIVALFGILAANFQHSYATVLREAKDPEAIALRKSILVTSLVTWFTTFYLLLEVIVHVLTNFNFIPQTGLALPWVSSGGSAAIAFSGLMGIALSMAARVYLRLHAREHAAEPR